MEKQMRADTHGAKSMLMSMSMPMDAIVWLGPVWSGLVWSGPTIGHMEDMPFSGVLYVTVPHLRLAGFVGHTHTHTLMRPTQPHNTVSSGHVQAPEKKTTANCPFAYGFWLVVFLFSQLAQLVIFIFISALGVFES